MTSSPLTRCALISLSLLVGGACDSAESTPAPAAEPAAEAKSPDGAEAKVAAAEAQAEVKTTEAKAAETKAGDAKAGDDEPGEAKADDAKAPDAEPGEPGGLAKMVDGVRDSVGTKTSSVGELVGKAKDGASAAAGELVESASGSSIDLGMYYWVGGTRPPSIIDIIDIPVPEGSDDPVMALANKYDYPDGDSAVLPADAVLPKGFAVKDEWVVITTTGERRGKAKGYGASGGASESHFLVVLDVEARGLAVRASDWKGKKAAVSLREAKPLDLSKAPGKSLWAAMRPGVMATLTGPAKKYLGRTKLGAKHVALWEGRFKDGFTHLVSFTYAKNPDAIGDDHVAGFLLADATGRVEAVFGPPDLTIDSSEVHYLVDLNGDGQDEVIWNSSYYEGDYTMLMAWDAAGAMHNRTLTGDGA